MLTDLFRLDGDPEILRSSDDLPPMSPGCDVRNIVFADKSWPSDRREVKGVTFRNVAFSKVRFERAKFTDCSFTDCLFIGAEFSEVEFHHCQFCDCNLWKASFRKVYLDPWCIKFDARYRDEAANVGISVFQSMLSNFAEERQDEFYMAADVRFRRWKRYQIPYDRRRKKISKLAAHTKWLSSILYDVVAGFGYRPGRFFIVTILLFLAVSTLNYFLIGDSISVNGERADASVVDTIFYSFSILTVLGFSSVLPIDPHAKILSVLEALMSIGWLGMFTSILVKRFLR